MKSLGYSIGQEMTAPAAVAAVDVEKEMGYPQIYIHEKEVALALELDDMNVGDEFTAKIRFRLKSKGVNEDEDGDGRRINATLALQAVDEIEVDGDTDDIFSIRAAQSSRS